MPRVYKGYRTGSGYALAHIRANNIRCRYYGWVCMAADIDVVKIDGKMRYFNVTTHKELKRK